MSENNDSWAVVDLMGHVTVAGRITKPGEFGGLWQIDIPEGDSYRTEFFGSQSVYRVRIVSEEIARAYARPSHEVIEYDAPIITRQEHQEAMRKAEMQYYKLQREVSVLRDRLTAVNALPSGEAVEHRVHWTYALRARAKVLIKLACSAKRVQPVMVRAHASNANR